MRLSVRDTVGSTLEVTFSTINGDDQPMDLTEGLHTYFKVWGFTRISVVGLEGAEHLDLLINNLRRQQNGPVRFDGELGRIYANNQSICVNEDTLLRQCIRIEKSGRLSTAVWNPWTLTASKMDDLGPEGWRDMVCVESTNLMENFVTVVPGAKHSMLVSHTAENI